VNLQQNGAASVAYNYAGANVLVTGGTSGIGAATAAAHCAAGAKIELIQPVEGTLRIYADVLPQGSQFALRFHHVGCRFQHRAEWDAFRSSLDPDRHRIAFESMAPDELSHFLYLDERERLGHYLEYMWLDAAASQFMQSVPAN
jgi:hypothetical protein